MSAFAKKKQGVTPEIAGYVADISAGRAIVRGRPVELSDLRQMEDVQARYRARLKAMLAHYRRWQAGYERERDAIERTYAAYEGIFLRRQIQDSWTLYVTVNRDYHAMLRVFLASLRQTPHRRAAG